MRPCCRLFEQALARLRAQYDLVIIEGAGSPVELNLAQYDLVNMRVAHLADAPVLLVGDIDRGGIFASLLGTLMLLEPAERARVKGLIVNKFRGDLALWRDGERLLAERAGVPVLGTVPFFRDIRIAEEDVVPLDEGSAAILQSPVRSDGSQLEVVIVRLPYLSNYDEFDALAAEARVHLCFVASPAEFPAHPDLIILPGTKNTLADLAWLWRQGLVQHIHRCVKDGSAVLGICGGYQMLGERIYDTLGVEGEAGCVEAGLGLLPVETSFVALHEKKTVRCDARLHASAARGLFRHLELQIFQAYQIHLGHTIVVQEPADVAGTTAFTTDQANQDGWLSPDGWCAGCYLHGLFENDNFRQCVLAALAERRQLQPVQSAHIPFRRQDEYDKLAALLREYLAIDQLKRTCNLL